MLMYFFFFKQKTAYEMRISDWSSDVCSSDLIAVAAALEAAAAQREADSASADVNLPEALRLFMVTRPLSRDVIGPSDAAERLQVVGRGSCRESVCQYVEILVVAVSLNKTKHDVMT